MNKICCSSWDVTKTKHTVNVNSCIPETGVCVFRNNM